MDCAAIHHGDTYKSQLKKYFIRFFFFWTILIYSGYTVCVIDWAESHAGPYAQ